MLASSPWVLVVVRAWVDPSGPRIRLLGSTSDGEEVSVVVGAPERAGAVLAEWLDGLRREPRRSGDGGRDGEFLGSP